LQYHRYGRKVLPMFCARPLESRDILNGMEDLQYPIGKFESPHHTASAAECEEWITQIAETSGRLRQSVSGLTDEQLDTAYRPDGWTVRQLVHHIADSHLNAYVRLRLALTEDGPTIRPYGQDRWAELEDAKSGRIEDSLLLIEALHNRWVRLAKGLDHDALHKTFFHPETDAEVSVQTLLAIYAWHGRHHVAHITGLRQRNGW